MDKVKKAVVLGPQDGQLASCSKKPNCVSTENHNLNRRMLPMSYGNLSLGEAKSLLLDVIHTMPRVEVKEEASGDIHVEYRTFVFEFFHDAEFNFDDVKKEVHFRSATRIGFADFGSNKRWLQSVYARFLQQVFIEEKNA